MLHRRAAPSYTAHPSCKPIQLLPTSSNAPYTMWLVAPTKFTVAHGSQILLGRPPAVDPGAGDEHQHSLGLAARWNRKPASELTPTTWHGPRTAHRPISTRFESAQPYGASTTGSLSLHLLTSLDEPAPSGSTGASRRCRGCSPPSPAFPGSGCPQLHQAAATAQRRRSLTSTRLRDASWRTPVRSNASESGLSLRTCRERRSRFINGERPDELSGDLGLVG